MKRFFFTSVLGLLTLIVASFNVQAQNEFVDLGLSVTWATCNVGANSPGKNGKYYTFDKALALENNGERLPTKEEFQEFSKLLRRHNWLKPRRHLPADTFFQGMMDSQRCRLFITKYKEKVIGCCACVHSEGDMFLWYSASRRKSYAMLHPNAVTIWNAIKQAQEEGMQHFRFVDVGLPFRRNPYRDFILSFGGKEVTGFRWFRISIRWVNALASWWWRE